MSEQSCLFCRIVRGELPAKYAHQADDVIAFHDIDPKAPTHILVIPRKHIASVQVLDDADTPVMGRLFAVARDLARAAGIAESGYRLVINAGRDAGQAVDHIHLHVLGGRHLKWPPG